jgi:hypothetical protein
MKKYAPPSIKALFARARGLLFVFWKRNKKRLVVLRNVFTFASAISNIRSCGIISG